MERKKFTDLIKDLVKLPDRQLVHAMQVVTAELLERTKKVLERLYNGKRNP